MSVTTIFKALACAGVAAAYNVETQVHKIENWNSKQPYSCAGEGGSQKLVFSDEPIGRGAFGTAHQVMQREELFIVKRIAMRNVRNQYFEEKLFAEINLLKANGNAVEIMMVDGRGSHKQAMIVMPLSAYMSEQDQDYAEEEQPILHMQSKSVYNRYAPCAEHRDLHRPCQCHAKFEDKMPYLNKLIQDLEDKKLQDEQDELHRMEADINEFQEELKTHPEAPPTVSHVVKTEERQLSFGRVEQISFAVYTIKQNESADGTTMRFSDWFKVADEIRKATTTRWLKFRLSYNSAFRGMTRADFAGLDAAFKALKATKWAMRSDADRVNIANCKIREDLLQKWMSEFKKIAGQNADRLAVMENAMEGLQKFEF